MYLCKQLITSMSLSDIGAAFGGKDHTTVIYACNSVTEKAKADLALRQLMDNLVKAVRS
jgi:chromosomal replication initiator protein